MLRIRLLGELSVELDGRPLPRLASGRARSLLAWLALHPGLHPRSRVASQFWPDILEESARGSLRTTLATLRRELGAGAAACVLATRDRVGIEDGPDVWIDARAFDRLVAEGRPADALALGRDELLRDLDDDWVLVARDAHRRRVAEALQALGDSAEAAEDWPAAVAYAREELALDALSDRAARTLVRRLARSGDRAGSVAAYRAFRATVREQLGIEPSEGTRALVEELLAEPNGATPALAPPLARPDRAPLVGRGDELRRLEAAWGRARAGDPAVVLVLGEAGSGKTRLLAELSRRVHAEGAAVMLGRCYEDAVIPYAPFTEALRGRAAARLAALPGWIATELARLLPELGAPPAAGAGGPQDARHRLFEAVAVIVSQAAEDAPVVLAIEDLHWADPPTLLLLAHLVRRLSRERLMVLGTVRDDEPDAALRELMGELERERRLERVELGGLDADGVAALVAAWLGDRASAALVAVVGRKSGGNPLFVEELARHVGETGAPSEALAAAAAGALPSGVKAVIAGRLARLDGAARTALAAAAVAGEEFRLADVAAAAEMGEGDVVEALDAAVGARFVREAATPGRYRFAHALVREAVADGSSAGRRALLHRRLARALEAAPGELDLPVLVHHLLGAGSTVDQHTAAGYALRAAELAVAQLAYEDAAEVLERAARTLDLAPGERALLLLALGDARARSGDAAAARPCFAEVAEAARALGDAELLAHAALGAAGLAVTVLPVRPDVRALLEEALDRLDEESALRPAVLGRLAIELYYVPPVIMRERLSARALEAGRRAGGDALLEALGARHVGLWGPDHLDERLEIADELVASARELGRREAELQGLNWRVVDLVELGRLDAARKAMEAHEALAAELRLLAYQWYAPMWRAMLALLAADGAGAERHREEAARIGHAAGDDNARLLLAVQDRTIRYTFGRLRSDDIAEIERSGAASGAEPAWRAWLGSIHLDRGDAEAARRELRRGLEGIPALPRDANWLYTMTGFSTLAAHLDDAGAAGALYPRLAPYAERTVSVGRATVCVGSTSLALGRLAATLGDDDGAERHLEAAIRHSTRVGAVIHAIAARWALAGVLERRGASERADAMRSAAVDAGRRLGYELPGALVRLY
jgi:DNA-binding SARP family transcriptional activator/tetratricopeptide (TPR) repeat protein